MEMWVTLWVEGRLALCSTRRATATVGCGGGEGKALWDMGGEVSRLRLASHQVEGGASR